jgi:hypothetical protein
MRGIGNPTPAEKLKPASPDLMTDAELLEQLLLAANHNMVSGEGIEDVRPVRMMLESGIELDDALSALTGNGSNSDIGYYRRRSLT